MELGKIQKEWIASLREHPEKQNIGTLGIGDELNYKACCLGEYGLICTKYGIADFKFSDNNLKDFCKKTSEHVVVNYKDLGLNGYDGVLVNSLIIDNGQSFDSLAKMNDNGMTWPEIADYVEANPENVFTKSL